MKARKALVARDQAVSAFSGALMRLCDVTASYGAALVDAEGETVDYAGGLLPFEIRVIAAEWRLVMQCANEGGATLGSLTSLFFRGTAKSFSVYGIADGYALVVQLAKRSLRPSHRAVSEAVWALATEAGLQLHESSEFARDRWHHVDITFDVVKRRPTHLWHAGTWLTLEVLGRYTETERGSRCYGYRARVVDGTELTLVREPLGVWYADNVPGAMPTSATLLDSRRSS